MLSNWIWIAWRRRLSTPPRAYHLLPPTDTSPLFQTPIFLFYSILFINLFDLFIYFYSFHLLSQTQQHNANRTVVLRTEAQKRHFYTHSFELWLVPSSSIFQDLPWSSPLGLFSTTPLRCFVYPSLFFSLCWCFNLKDCDFVCGKNEFYDCYWFLLLWISFSDLVGVWEGRVNV